MELYEFIIETNAKDRDVLVDISKQESNNVSTFIPYEKYS